MAGVYFLGNKLILIGLFIYLFFSSQAKEVRRVADNMVQLGKEVLLFRNSNLVY